MHIMQDQSINIFVSQNGSQEQKDCTNRHFQQCTNDLCIPSKLYLSVGQAGPQPGFCRGGSNICAQKFFVTMPILIDHTHQVEDCKPVFCPHWSVVVGPTITQPILTTTQPTFTTNNKVKAVKCCIFTHNSTTTHTILGRTLANATLMYPFRKEKLGSALLDTPLGPSSLLINLQFKRPEMPFVCSHTCSILWYYTNCMQGLIQKAGFDRTPRTSLATGLHILINVLCNLLKILCTFFLL